MAGHIAPKLQPVFRLLHVYILRHKGRFGRLWETPFPTPGIIGRFAERPPLPSAFAAKHTFKRTELSREGILVAPS